LEQAVILLLNNGGSRLKISAETFEKVLHALSLHMHQRKLQLAF